MFESSPPLKVPLRFNDVREVRRFIAEDRGLSRLLEEVTVRLDGAESGKDPGHDLAHCLRVAFWTVRLGGSVVDARCAIAASLLHDVVNLSKDAPNRADASTMSAEVARELLPNLGFSARQSESIAQAIVVHSFSLGRIPTTPLGEALQDADRLEALGALGILRTASCGVRLGATYFDPSDPWGEGRRLDDKKFTVDHFFVKLLGLPRTMRTRAGRQEAMRRREHMLTFLRELGSEILIAPPAQLGSDDPGDRGSLRRTEDAQELVYEQSAEDYDRLVSAEDCDSSLIRELDRIVSLRGARVLEVGVGTGRITRQLVACGAEVTGFDRTEPMLAVARKNLREYPTSAWNLSCADARDLPLEGSSFDVAVAGWVFGHFRSWMADHWQANVGAALDELERNVRSGGTLVVIETLGTGSTEPAPPNAALAEYYAWLEGRGFTRTAIATDYLFPDVETASAVLERFFGEELARRVRDRGWSRVPEWSGVWAKKKGTRRAG
jgi:uncharacterized protein